MNDLTEFSAVHCDSDLDNGIARQIYIDGYPKDDNAEGKVVARVIKSKSGDIITVWQENAYRMNEYVRRLIQDAKERLTSA